MTSPVTIGPCTLYHGDCREILPALSGIHACVTDPPAGISFMGKQWDTDHGGRDEWVKAFAEMAGLVRATLLPGAHALVWSIPRTSHWTATAWEDGGFEVRDRIAHCFGSGFPKSLDVSKSIDRMAGAVREVVGNYGRSFRPHSENTESGWYSPSHDIHGNITAPATDAAKQWQGWGTALKPAIEDWWLLRNPLIGTVAENVLAHGCGGLNIDGCRIEADWANDPSKRGFGYGVMKQGERGKYIERANGELGMNDKTQWKPSQGRFPANLIHDGSEEVVGMFPNADGAVSNGRLGAQGMCYRPKGPMPQVPGYDDTGSAARFFYAAKASKSDRDEGCEGLARKVNADWPQSLDGDDSRGASPRGNHHPTVKSTALMRYLCRLITPPGGVILDPFMGSGSTGKAAVLEGFRFIGIERDPEYFEIACARIRAAVGQPKQEALL